MRNLHNQDCVLHFPNVCVCVFLISVKAKAPGLLSWLCVRCNCGARRFSFSNDSNSRFGRRGCPPGCKRCGRTCTAFGGWLQKRAGRSSKDWSCYVLKLGLVGLVVCLVSWFIGWLPAFPTSPASLGPWAQRLVWQRLYGRFRVWFGDFWGNPEGRLQPNLVQVMLGMLPVAASACKKKALV